MTFISLLTSQNDLVRLSSQPNMMRDKVFVGLPLSVVDRNGVDNNRYLAVKLNKWFDRPLRERAAALESTGNRLVLENPDHNAGWRTFMDTSEMRRRDKGNPLSEIWCFMLLNIVLRESPSKYFAGQQSLTEFFAERFKLNLDRDLRPRLFIEQVSHDLFDTVEIQESLDLKVRSAVEQENLYASMDNLQMGLESFMEVLMGLMGLLSGVTEILLLNFILETFIGYVGMLHELEKMEGDGIITEDEAFGSWFALVGVFLPLGNLTAGLKAGAMKTLTEIGMSVAAVAVLVLQIALALLKGATSLLEYLAADEAGFDGYGQYDSQSTLFIPA